MKSSSFFLETSPLTVAMSLVPWDSDVFGFPVAQIEKLQVADAVLAASVFRKAEDWIANEKVRLVSCRLNNRSLAEAFFLENMGFRFVEMVLHPQILNLNELLLENHGLSVVPATVADLPRMITIAESAFENERYHVDPRVDSDRANTRYGNWVKSSLEHPQQSLLKVVDGETLVAIFVVEIFECGKAYWHLTAVSPALQGKGLGLRSWQAMMRYHQSQGLDSIETTISVRNIKVLNLYARLGFRFLPPEMTFHYLP